MLDHLERSGVQFDGGWVYGDIAYNHAPFFSPTMYRQQLKPAHARQIAWFKERGLPATIVRLFNTVGPRQTGRKIILVL